MLSDKSGSLFMAHLSHSMAGKHKSKSEEHALPKVLSALKPSNSSIENKLKPCDRKDSEDDSNYITNSDNEKSAN